MMKQAKAQEDLKKRQQQQQQQQSNSKNQQVNATAPATASAGPSAFKRDGSKTLFEQIYSGMLCYIVF